MDQPLDGAIDAHAHLMPERLRAAIRDALHEQALLSGAVERFLGGTAAQRP